GTDDKSTDFVSFGLDTERGVHGFVDHSGHILSSCFGLAWHKRRGVLCEHNFPPGRCRMRLSGHGATDYGGASARTEHPARSRNSRDRWAWSANPVTAAVSAAGIPARTAASARWNRRIRANILGPYPNATRLRRCSI